MKNAIYTIHVVRPIDAPPQAVWDRISHHADTHTWVLPARVRLLSPGQGAVNGLGAIREVAFPSRPRWPVIQERITAFEAPSTFSYSIIKGAMPGLRAHLGTLTVDVLGAARSQLTWHIDFEFAPWHPSRLIAPSFMRTFDRVIEDAVSELARQLRWAA